MLVFTRKSGERFHIGSDVEVVVLESSSGKVKLGVIAPRSVSVDRGEVRSRKEAVLSVPTRAALNEVGVPKDKDRVVLDLAGLDYVSSSDVNSIMRLRSEACRFGSSFSLRNVSAQVSEVLTVCHLDDLLLGG